MRILITGGAGFIGSHVADAFLAAGHDVGVLDDLSSGSKANLDPRVRFWQADIRDPAVDSILAEFRPELVSHHAAQMSVGVSVREPKRDADINILGTLNLLEAAVRHARAGGAKLVEAYPVEPYSPEMPAAFAWTGIASAFREAGFKEVLRRSRTRPIMRFKTVTRRTR